MFALIMTLCRTMFALRDTPMCHPERRPQKRLLFEKWYKNAVAAEPVRAIFACEYWDLSGEFPPDFFEDFSLINNEDRNLIQANVYRAVKT